MNKKDINKYSIISYHIRYIRMESNPKDMIVSKKSRASAYALTLLVIIATMASGCLQDDSEESYTVLVSFIATASGPAEIFLPLPEYGPLVKRLKVSDGKGDFEVVNTPYGRCMKITFDSFIKINAKVHPSEPDEIEAMTVDLTTMEPEIIDDEYRYFWCNATSSAVDSFQFLINMEENVNYTCYSFYSSNLENLTIGWHRYQSEYSTGKQFAP